MKFEAFSFFILLLAPENVQEVIHRRRVADLRLARAFGAVEAARKAVRWTFPARLALQILVARALEVEVQPKIRGRRKNEAPDRPAIRIVAAIPAAIRVAVLDLSLFLVTKGRPVSSSDDVLPGRPLDFYYQHRRVSISRRRRLKLSCAERNLVCSEFNLVGEEKKNNTDFARTRWGTEFSFHLMFSF